MPQNLPHVVAHVAVALDGTPRGFQPDLEEYYGLVTTWREDVTLTGSETILAQEAALAAATPGPGPNPDGPLLAVVDSRSRVTAWDALREAGYWRDVRPLRGPAPGEPVDLAAALAGFAADGATTVRVDSGGRLIGVLLDRGLVDEVSLLVHPCLGGGSPWTNEGGAGTTFTLTHEERRGSGLVWLRYAVTPG